MDAPPLSDVTGARLNEYRAHDCMKWLACRAAAPTMQDASERYLKLFPNSFGRNEVKKELELLTSQRLEYAQRALSLPATTLGTDWAAPLVGVQTLVSGFLAMAHSASLLGRIPGIKRIPFNTRCPVQTQEANYAWVQQGFAKTISQEAFATGVTLAPLKVAGTVIFTEEVLKLVNPGTEQMLNDQLKAGLVSFTDTAFLSTSAAVADVSPAGILAPPLVAVTPGATFAASMDALISAFFTARPGASEDVCLIAGPAKAAQLRALNGGGGLGYPIIVTAAAGTKVVMADGRGLLYADGGVTLDVTREASVQMNTTPDSPATAATVFVSLWQTNEVGIKTERFLNFAATAVGGSSVQYLA